jgi:hypothetical protein
VEKLTIGRGSSEIMLLGGLFNITTRTTRQAPERRGEPRTPVQGARTPSGASNVVPFVIPGTSANPTQLNLFKRKIIKTPKGGENRLPSSSGCSDTITPPGSPHFHGMSAQPTQPTRVANDKNSVLLRHYSGANRAKEKPRTNSFTHTRCMNCNSQFIVNTSSSPRNPARSISGEFCSGECRCSFLASGIDQQYHETNETFIETFIDSSDDDEW